MQVVFGGGPAGLATARALVAAGEEVRVVTRKGRPELPEGASLAHGDASDPAFAREVCRGASVVYQCLNAPYDRWPEQFPPLQRGVLAGARAAGARLVTLENLYGYGPVDGPLTESLPLAAQTRKGRVRAEMTRELLDAHARGDVEVTIGRASDFFGPGVVESMLGQRFFGRILAGRAAQGVGDPDRLHSFAYIPDVGRALALLGSRAEAPGRAWHLPVAPAWSVRRVLAHTEARLGRRVRYQAAPKPLLWLLSWSDPSAGEVIEMVYQFERDFVVDDRAFRETFDLAPTPLPEALDATLAWFGAKGESSSPGARASDTVEQTERGRRLQRP